MKYKLQRKQSDPENDMRLMDLERNTVLGYIIRYTQYGNVWFRATVTKCGTVYGRDAQDLQNAIAFILEKNHLLTTELRDKLLSHGEDRV